MSWNNNKRGPARTKASYRSILGQAMSCPGALKPHSDERCFHLPKYRCSSPVLFSHVDKQVHFRWSNIPTSGRCNAPSLTNYIPFFERGGRTFSTWMKIYDCCVSVVGRSCKLFFTMKWYTRNENGTTFEAVFIELFH